MSWFSSWRQKKKKFDFNSFLVSQAKQQRQHEDAEEFQRQVEQAQKEQQQGQSTGGTTAKASASGYASSVRSRVSSLSSSLFQPKSFSLVLTDEDLKGLELQRKLDALKKQGKEMKESQKQEIDILNQVSKQWKMKLKDRLKEGIDWSEYLEVAQQVIEEIEKEWERERNGGVEKNEDNEDAGSTAGSTSSVEGRREADLLKAMHNVDLQERVRMMLQEQTNDEILRLYKMESTIKEDFAEREAKLLSEMAAMNANVQKHRECHERRLEISKQMLERAEQAVQKHVDRIYGALNNRDKEAGADDDQEEEEESSDSDSWEEEPKPKPIPRRPVLAAKSYSERVLGVNEEEKKERESMKAKSAAASPAVIAEDDENDDEHVDDGNDYPSSSSHSEDKATTPQNGRRSDLNGRSSTMTVPSYARTTGASRNTRVPVTRTGSGHGGAGSTLPSRTIGGRVTSPRLSSIRKTAGGPSTTTTTTASAASHRPTPSRVAPRRVASGSAARK
jgi:hypothetical protein